LAQDRCLFRLLLSASFIVRARTSASRAAERARRGAHDLAHVGVRLPLR